MLQEIRNPEKGFLSTGEIALMLRVTRMSVYRWVRMGKLRAFCTPGGNYRILTKDFDRFLKEFGMKKFVSHTATARHPLIKILVVDDEPKIVETIKLFLEEANPNFHVIGATTGFDAGRLIHTFNPDIVILDLIMPGVDGFEVCRQIKSDSLTKHIKVIAITGYASEENLQRIKRERADACIAKPFDYNELVEEIEKLATHKRQGK